MGARGPRPDPAQAAKGFPGKRRSKAERAAVEAQRLAEMLAPTGPADADVPPMLREAKYAPAAALWRRLAPELRRTHRLPIESEFFLVQLCIYVQEWVSQTEDLHTKGFSQAIQTVAGGKMERRRPLIHDRQQAFQNCMELSARFGLTPTDMYSLFKGQAAVAPTRPDLFGGARQTTPAPAPSEEVEAQTGRVGGLGRMRSPPPPGEAVN